MTFWKLSEAENQQYQDDGFLIVRGLFDTEEMQLIREKSQRERERLHERSHGGTDVQGRSSTSCFWNHPGDDLFGAVSRCERLVGAMEQLLGDEVYHWHSKMMLKEARTGGAWEWHQDYGYWYDNGCLYPDLASCMIAVDRATRDNGCLQVLRASHRMGRMNHSTLPGGQTGADPDRVAQAVNRLERLHVELEQGDAVIFHANTLHCSDANVSEHPRWTLICCYNTRHNDPFEINVHPAYTPLERVPDTAVKEWGRRELATQ